jgi:RNA polymerase sigma-70 factor (ECF subfamily)
VPRALAFAVSLLGHQADAEDVVQDCYRRLIARSAHYDLPRDGLRLLFKSISNACCNLVQRRRNAASLSVVGEAATAARQSASAAPGQELERQELESTVAAALAELPLNQRAVVELRSLGHTVREIADMLEVSEGNARVLLHRARTQLGQRLAPYLEEHLQ